MKVKSLLLMAVVASMGLVSCSKDENGADIQADNAPKSVTINLANVKAATRSTGGTDITKGTDITLTKYQIFFTDGTTVYQAKQADGQTAADQFIDGTDVTTTKRSFHFLPASVNKVIVIGNHDEIAVNYVDGKASAPNFDEALAIATEQNADALTLYDESTLTREPADAEDAHNPLYSATLEPKPRIARIFIENFSCNYDVDKYTDLHITAIALNNYNTTSTLENNTVGGLKYTALSNSNVWGWFDELAEADAKTDNFAYDALNIDLSGTLNQTITKPAGALYYHIFAGTTVPQLVIRGIGSSTPLYLATVRFIDETTKEEIKDWKAGMIYKMDFAFKASQLAMTDKCIDITVTPVAWAVTTVTPEF